MHVGFIGLDHTGQQIVSRLVQAGHRLTVYDPIREIPETLLWAGAMVADSIEEVCRSADAVFTMLPGDDAAEDVILGVGGVVESLPRGAVHIGSSTVSVPCSDAIVEAHWDAGQQYIAAPVLVGSELAADEQLIVIAGGCQATIVRIEPLLSPIGPLAELAGWPSHANSIHLGAMCDDSTLSQFLVTHRASHLSRSLDTKGVLQ